MALKTDLQALTARTLTALEASHDYDTYSKRVWRFVEKLVEEGRQFRFRNLVTGSRVNEQELVQLIPSYKSDYLTVFSFQHFVSLFEDYFFALLRFWLAAYPGSLSKKQVDLGTLIKSNDLNAVILTIIDKELNELKYERLADWFAYLQRLVKLDCPTAEEIEALAEIKASRDILVHNNGLVNAVYLSKAGTRSRYKEGEQLEITDQYHRESWATIHKVINDLAVAVSAKLPQDKP